MSFPVYFPDTPPIPLPPGHRFPAEKYGMLRSAVASGGILDGNNLKPSPEATDVELEHGHDRDYVMAVREGRLTREQQARIGLPWSEVLVARSLATVGGTLAAARDALHHLIAGQLAGGTHHARRDGGAGFCVFNDCAVSILALLADKSIRRAAVLDLDVHQGDGNAAILAGEPRAFVASVHGANNYPFEKPPSDLDIGLPDGTADAEYLAACTWACDAVLAEKPDIVFYIAGVDPLASDRLGRLSITHTGLLRRDRLVLGACRSMGIPVVVLIGGGYGEPIADTVEAYANTWRAAREVFG